MYILTKIGRAELESQHWTTREFASATTCNKDRLTPLLLRVFPPPFGPKILKKLLSFFKHWEADVHYRLANDDSDEEELVEFSILRHGDENRLPTYADREDLAALYAAMLTRQHSTPSQLSVYDSAKDFDEWFDEWNTPSNELIYEPMFFVRRFMDHEASKRKSRVIAFLYGDRRKVSDEVPGITDNVQIEGLFPVPRVGLFCIWYLVGEKNNWLPGESSLLSEDAKSRIKVGDHRTSQKFVMDLLNELRPDIEKRRISYIIFEVDDDSDDATSRLRLFHTVEKQVRRAASADTYISGLKAYVLDFPYAVPRTVAGSNKDRRVKIDYLQHRLACVPLTVELQRSFETGQIPYNMAEALFANVLESYYDSELSPKTQKALRNAIEVQFNKFVRAYADQNSGYKPVRCLTLDQYLEEIE